MVGRVRTAARPDLPRFLSHADPGLREARRTSPMPFDAMPFDAMPLAPLPFAGLCAVALVAGCMERSRAGAGC